MDYLNNSKQFFELKYLKGTQNILIQFIFSELKFYTKINI
jgi:hypothetical protein